MVDLPLLEEIPQIIMSVIFLFSVLGGIVIFINTDYPKVFAFSREISYVASIVNENVEVGFGLEDGMVARAEGNSVVVSIDETRSEDEFVGSGVEVYNVGDNLIVRRVS